MVSPGVVPWMSDARGTWLEHARDWISRNVEALGLGPLTDVEFVRERVWGAVARVVTRERVLFFKAQGVRARLEPVLVSDIAERWPGLGADVLAADFERAWLLLADHGTPMSGWLDAEGQAVVFEKLIPRYARLQRESNGLIERWIAAGAPDRRVANVPELLERLLAGDPWGFVLPLELEQRRAIDAGVLDLVRVCDELGATPFADALDHCDMHGGNVLIKGGTARLIDWGDACITHPFTSLFATYQHVVAKMPRGDRRGVALRLRDIYLEAWSDLASSRELRDAYGHAIWLGHVIRALSFAYMLDMAEARHREAVARFLMQWTEKRTLLGRGDELVEAIASDVE